MKSHANAEYTAERSEQTSRHVAARVTSTLPYIHLCLNIHSSSSIRVSARQKEEEKEEGEGGGRGDLTHSEFTGPQPFRSRLVAGPRVAFRGQQARGARCAHTRHSVKSYANAGRLAGSPAARNNRRVAGTRFRSTDGGGGGGGGVAVERLYARFVKLCKVHGARRGNSCSSSSSLACFARR